MLAGVFKDRSEAGQLLAEHLAEFRGRNDVTVFGLARGGVPVGCAVAKALDLPFDVIVVRKLGTPGQEELAMGAIAPEGIRVVNPQVMRAFPHSEKVLDTIEQRERQELERREALYRGSKPYSILKNKIALLVDDGLATGATMRAAIDWVAGQGAREVVVAVPVGSSQTCSEIEAEHVRCICLMSPDDFCSVGSWYEDFGQVSDAEVVELLGHADTRTIVSEN